VVGHGSAEPDNRTLSGVLGLSVGGEDVEVALDVLHAGGVEQACNVILCAANMELVHDGTERGICMLTLSVCVKFGMERAGTLLSIARAADRVPNAQRGRGEGLGRGAGRQAGESAARK
jgi:hypothetical protein